MVAFMIVIIALGHIIVALKPYLLYSP